MCGAALALQRPPRRRPKRKRPQLKPGFIAPLAPTRIGGCSLVVLTPCWTSGVVRTYVHRVWGLGTKRRRDSGPRIQAPGFRPPDSGPRPQDSGPRIQAPGPRLQPPRGAVLAWFECSFVRTYARMYMRTRVEGPGSWVGYALFVGSHWFLLSVS